MTSVGTHTALAGLGATAAWLTFVTDAAPAQFFVAGALVLLPARAFVRRFPLAGRVHRASAAAAVGVLVLTTVGLVGHLVGHAPAASLAALVLLSSSLGLLRPAVRRGRRVLPDGIRRSGAVPGAVRVPPEVVVVAERVAGPAPVLPAVHRAG